MEAENRYIVLPDLDKKIEEAIYDAINFFDKKCPYCDSLLFTGHIRNKIHLDHFIPIAKGGQHVPWNILPVCQKCNSKKIAIKPKLFLSAQINEKCEKYLIKVREKYIGQIQIDLEKYAQIKSLFSGIESTSQTKNNLTELMKAIYQIVTNKPYEEVHQKNGTSSDEGELISKYFVKGNKHSIRLTTTEIMAEIKTLTGIDVNINSIGRELKKLGFIRKSTRVGQYKEKVRSKWCVEKINRTSGENDNK